MSIPINKKSPNCYNKHQHKLIVLISTLDYINKKYPKYTQSIILYCFNKNLKRNGQNPIKLKTLQNYLYELEKKLKVTTNYYKHMGVNCGTEIYYKLNYQKKECYPKINKFFLGKKHSRFGKRVEIGLKEKFNKNGSVDFKECLSNKNNNIKEEKNKKIEKFQIIKYANKCNFKYKEILPFILNLDFNKDTKIKMLKVSKIIEIKLLKSKNLFLNQSFFKEKQKKLKEIIENTKKQLEKNGYNVEQLETKFKKIYENYKNKPHFIIEHQKYNDLGKITFKLEKSIELKKENSQKDCENMKKNIFNILIERLKEKANIEIIKPIIKTYLNSKKKLEYNKVFGTYHDELLELIKNENNSLILKKVIWGFNMKSAPEPTKKGKCKVECQNKERFILIEKENGKAMYHTKIMMDVYKFGVYEKKNEFRVSLRALHNGERIVEETHLYPIKEGDKFIGIFYGFRKPIKKAFVKYETNGIRKSYGFARAYYMEVRFKAGSVFFYFKGLYRLLDKERMNNHYNKILFSMFTDLEKQVYEFYGKKYPEQGPLTKWIIKNLK